MKNYANRLKSIEDRINEKLGTCQVCHGKGAGPSLVIVRDPENVPPVQACSRCGKSALEKRIIIKLPPESPIPRDVNKPLTKQ